MIGGLREFRMLDALFLAFKRFSSRGEWLLGNRYCEPRAEASNGRRSIRFAAKLKHPNEHYFPALIVQATDPATGAPICGVQRTFLAWRGGGKAQVRPKDQKMSLGPCKGGVARLSERVDGGPLLIGKGVETTLTAMQATGLPGWATFGTPTSLTFARGLRRPRAASDTSAGARCARSTQPPPWRTATRKALGDIRGRWSRI
jgi:hypothetical protein